MPVSKGMKALDPLIHVWLKAFEEHHAMHTRWLK